MVQRQVYVNNFSFTIPSGVNTAFFNQYVIPYTFNSSVDNLFGGWLDPTNPILTTWEHIQFEAITFTIKLYYQDTTGRVTNPEATWYRDIPRRYTIGASTPDNVSYGNWDPAFFNPAGSVAQIITANKLRDANFYSRRGNTYTVTYQVPRSRQRRLDVGSLLTWGSGTSAAGDRRLRNIWTLINWQTSNDPQNYSGQTTLASDSSSVIPGFNVMMIPDIVPISINGTTVTQLGIFSVKVESNFRFRLFNKVPPPGVNKALNAEGEDFAFL